MWCKDENKQSLLHSFYLSNFTLKHNSIHQDILESATRGMSTLAELLFAGTKFHEASESNKISLEVFYLRNCNFLVFV